MTYPNSVVTTYNYDSAGRLESIVHSRGGQTLKSFTYQFDDNGNITKITYQDGSYIDYTYDEWNRLTGEHKKNSGGQSLYQIQYSFDNTAGDTGNIYQKIVTRGGSPETTTFTYDAYNKLTNITYPDSSTETLTYDDNGQLITRNKSTGDTTTYEWNDQGFLKKVTLPDSEEVEYSYDGMSRLTGRKVKSSGGETVSDDRFVQSGWDIVSESDKNEWRTYYTGMSMIDDSDSPKYFHYNHRGDTILVTDRDGNVIHDIYYEAYGTTLNSSGTPISTSSLDNIPNLFVGEFGIRYDSKTELNYVRMRYFSENLMRFISPDILLANNRYNYSYNNPINFIDINGAEPTDRIMWRMIREKEERQKIKMTASQMGVPELLAQYWLEGDPYQLGVKMPVKLIADPEFAKIARAYEAIFRYKQKTNPKGVCESHAIHIYYFLHKLAPPSKYFYRIVAIGESKLSPRPPENRTYSHRAVGVFAADGHPVAVLDPFQGRNYDINLGFYHVPFVQLLADWGDAPKIWAPDEWIAKRTYQWSGLDTNKNFYWDPPDLGYKEHSFYKKWVEKYGPIKPKRCNHESIKPILAP